MGMGSGAEITVWPPELFPEDAQRQGVKNFGPADKITPILPNLGELQCSLKVGHILRTANVNVVPVRKPL